MSGITEVARPKVNLTLKVSGRRQDGYHEIESLIVFAAGLGDVVRLVPGNRTSLLTSGPFASAISGENLITTALARLGEVAPGITLGSVVLEKHLPVAGGIGGGSDPACGLSRQSWTR
jgi:4-diphosphocytidyl-2-C-methyl-D-erythritol kinase